MSDHRFRLRVAAAVTASTLVAALVLSGCSSGTPKSATTVTATVTATATATVTATPSPAQKPSTADGGPCATATLAAAVTEAPEGEASGARYYLVILTNIGSTKCTLDGYPRVEFVGDGDGTTIGPEAVHDHTEGTPYGGTIEPGESAVADLVIRPADCDGAEVTVDGFRVFPPGQSKALFAADETNDGCSGSNVVLHVGGFQVGNPFDF